MTQPGKILIVDDEDNIRAGLHTVLTRAGHEVKAVADAEAALAALQFFTAETAVIDIRLPGMNGTELLAGIREEQPHLAVIMLTGHGTLETAMQAVRQGAHDYLLKPAKPEAILTAVASALVATRRRRAEARFLQSVREGLAQIERPTAQENRQAAQPDDKITVGAITIFSRSHEVRRAGEIVDLTPSEYKLLVALASRPGEVIDYVKLVNQTLDYTTQAWEAKELIKRHVFTLRQKIEPNPAQPQYVQNVRGVGYRLANQ